jgi:cobalt/nickel transport protein
MKSYSPNPQTGREEVIVMRPTLILLMLLIGAATMNASAHELWVELNDLVDVGESQEAYVFWGHADDPASLALPVIDKTYLVTPDGQKITTRMDEEVGKLFVGYGRVGEVGISPLTTFWPGNYVFVVERAPTYSNVTQRLGYSSAAAVINSGNDGSSSFKSGLPVEITTDRPLYQIKNEDIVTFTIKYNDQQVNATYSAYPQMTETNVQSGFTGETDSFPIDFNQTGLWILSTRYDFVGDGEWTATYDHSGGAFKTGDTVPYDTTRYSTVLSIWVRK